MRMPDGNASDAGDPALDDDGGGEVDPSPDPWCDCCADGVASSPDVGDTGRDDADENDRWATGSLLPTPGTRWGCGRPICRVLLSSNRERCSIRKYIFNFQAPFFGTFKLTLNSIRF